MCPRIRVCDVRALTDELRSLVLIVEDDPDSRLMLASALTFEGFEVMTASNGMEALELALKHRPSLILLDLMMPVMDGFAFRAEQLRDQRIASIPVICVSGRYDAASTALSLGMAGYAAKPILFDDFLPMVSRLCSPAPRGPVGQRRP